MGNKELPGFIGTDVNINEPKKTVKKLASGNTIWVPADEEGRYTDNDIYITLTSAIGGTETRIYKLKQISSPLGELVYQGNKYWVFDITQESGNAAVINIGIEGLIGIKE